MKKPVLIAAALVVPAVSAFGAGFQLNLQGLRQLAMGGGGTAWPWDASTVFYNPGGISRLQRFQAYGSVQFTFPRIKYVQAPTGGYAYEPEENTSTTFNFYVGGPLKEGSRLGVGLGVYTPFGSSLTWPENWTGRYINQSISLQSIYIQPTLSYRLNDIVSIGAGFVYGIGKVNIKRALPTIDQNGNDGRVELDGNASGIGYNLGVQLKASDNLQFGVNYRSLVKMKVDDGDATFTVPAVIDNNFPDGKFTTSITLPDVLSVGVAYRPCKKLTLQLDFNRVGWESYDTLRFDFEQNTASLKDSKTPRLYHTATAIRLGGNYEFTESFSGMLGVAYDPTPTREGYVSPESPDANRWLFSGGISVKPTKNMTVLAALSYVTTGERSAAFVADGFDGTYKLKSITAGIGLTYGF